MTPLNQNCLPARETVKPISSLYKAWRDSLQQKQDSEAVAWVSQGDSQGAESESLGV